MMTAQLLSGKPLAAEIERELSQKVREKMSKGHRAPQLAVILTGDNPASAIYVQRKQEACQRIGIISTLHKIPADAPEHQLFTLIDTLNKDDKVDGILVQLPLPASFSSQKIIESIDPKKDVDGFHPYNIGRLATQHPALRPCTPYGIIRLLKHAGIVLTGLHAVIVGASNIVGRPMMLELLLEGVTVTLCHSKTKNLDTHVRDADLLISAIGKRHVIQSDWIKKNAIVVDIGIHRTEDNQIHGDLEFDTAKEKASFITPVPGGVGPMTVAILMENTLRAGGYLS